VGEIDADVCWLSCEHALASSFVEGAESPGKTHCGTVYHALLYRYVSREVDGLAGVGLSSAHSADQAVLQVRSSGRARELLTSSVAGSDLFEVRAGRRLFARAFRFIPKPAFMGLNMVLLLVGIG